MYRHRSLLMALIAAIVLLPVVAACAPGGEQPLGSKENPIKMAMVPYVETQKLITDFKPFVEILEKETGYKIEFSVPTSDAATIEAMGAKKIDVAWFGPLAYVIAHDRYGAEVVLVSQEAKSHSTKYRGMILVRTDSGINSLADLKGKRFAFSSPTSTSGYLYPAQVFVKNGIKPDKTFFSEVVFAGGHDKAVIALYNKQVDGAACYEDVREEIVKSTLPDIMEKTKVLAYTEWIPNDNVAIGKHVPKEVRDRLVKGLQAAIRSPEGKKALVKTVTTEDLLPIEDSAYDPVRQVAKEMGINLADLLPKPKPTPMPTP